MVVAQAQKNDVAAGKVTFTFRRLLRDRCSANQLVDCCENRRTQIVVDSTRPAWSPRSAPVMPQARRQSAGGGRRPVAYLETAPEQARRTRVKAPLGFSHEIRDVEDGNIRR
jgi:hypothetical protein